MLLLANASIGDEILPEYDVWLRLLDDEAILLSWLGVELCYEQCSPIIKITEEDYDTSVERRKVDVLAGIAFGDMLESGRVNQFQLIIAGMIL